MVYVTIHANYVPQRLAQAETTGVPIDLLEMVVGDGNGNEIMPTQS